MGCIWSKEKYNALEESNVEKNKRSFIRNNNSKDISEDDNNNYITLTKNAKVLAFLQSRSQRSHKVVQISRRETKERSSFRSRLDRSLRILNGENSTDNQEADIDTSIEFTGATNSNSTDSTDLFMSNTGDMSSTRNSVSNHHNTDTINENAIKRLSMDNSFFYESFENVTNCRECQSLFTTLKTKHNCMVCGGVFCHNCCPFIKSSLNPITYALNVCMSDCVDGDDNKENNKSSPIATSSSNKSNPISRCCHGCNIGNIPGVHIKEMIERKLVSINFQSNQSTSIPVENIPLKLIESSTKDDIVDVTTNGYFELINKSKAPCCVKLVYPNKHSNPLWEVPRPSYIILPPHSTITTPLKSSCSYLELYVLVDSGFWMNVIELYENCVCYRIQLKNSKNVLLKHKGNGKVETRKCNSILHKTGLLQKIKFHSDGDSSPTNQQQSNNNIENSNIEMLFTSLPE
eukprot:gene5016-7003_t